MIRILKTQIKNILNLYLRWICQSEFEQQSFIRFNERPVEFAFVFRHITQLYPKKILDIGTGTSALPDLMRNCGCVVTAIDNFRDYWTSQTLNRHFHIIDDDITDSRLNDRFDLITCISVLEHIRKSDAAVRNMFRLLDREGYLILTFPYTENSYIENVYGLEGASYGQDLPYICQSYSRKELNKWFHDNDGRIVEQEYWQFWDGSYWTVGDQIIPPKRVGRRDRHQMSCLLIKKID